ncbi:hypothetical protein B0H67DRAFT_475859 [Lasiosphaeris hirsuta]|uniref:tRNA (uracil-O(2)-)-methyltransferase n=1 Tax=Lasiosphaeris hirsuta TaxID=260670 RepID=A0AA40B8M8_9PEZI|nr:hypothetical protein B0H67DRAFT_475859 [Lasiosphaeris hirsuta]
MSFEPSELADDAVPIVFQHGEDDADVAAWRPRFCQGCTFPPAIFTSVMANLVKNPNINSSLLFRADVLHDHEGGQSGAVPPELAHNSPKIPSFHGFELQRYIIRRLVPRNPQVDRPIDQTCLRYEKKLPADDDHCHDKDNNGVEWTLVVYLPHVSSEAEMPFYHPKVQGIAFMHEWTAAESRGAISISYQFFDGSDYSAVKLKRTAYQLLKVIYKHGQGRVAGYQKRVHHDVMIPQARVQNTYTALKQKYARALITGWAESTDPEKHVFEDLGIAAFMIELWADMYKTTPFPGFVDIGCGNGLLVYILNQEGFKGWGFDARVRKSWAAYNTVGQQPDGGDSLQQLVLLPPPVSRAGILEISSDDFAEELTHDGHFPKDTFIISNHADELTPWTPILAAMSDCPFIMIPCCSHNLTGARQRAPPPKDKNKAESGYASLVQWVSEIAKDCGWEVEQEMLRIPSTRNTALVGRTKQPGFDFSSLDIHAIVDRYGGTAGYLEAVVKLAKKCAAPAAQKTTEH